MLLCRSWFLRRKENSVCTLNYSTATKKGQMIKSDWSRFETLPLWGPVNFCMLLFILQTPFSFFLSSFFCYLCWLSYPVPVSNIAQKVYRLSFAGYRAYVCLFHTLFLRNIAHISVSFITRLEHSGLVSSCGCCLTIGFVKGRQTSLPVTDWEAISLLAPAPFLLWLLSPRSLQALSLFCP